MNDEKPFHELQCTNLMPSTTLLDFHSEPCRSLFRESVIFQWLLYSIEKLLIANQDHLKKNEKVDSTHLNQSKPLLSHNFTSSPRPRFMRSTQ